jgi:tyrosinase
MMPKFTRRSFVAGAAAIPFAIWLEKYAYGQAPPPPGPHVRYSAFSPQGIAMLKIYAQAVGKMKTAIAEGNPTSWVFQWYAHFVKGDTTKAAELARIYPSPSPWKSLATEMWNTCQAHSAGQDENFFLPWHRMFVYYFETIIRQVSGNNTFTLPYWNYSVTGANRGVVPPQFRMPTDPVFKSLYVKKRNKLANDGKNIAQGQPDDPLSLISLAQCTYGKSGGNQGFCATIDFGLVGGIHGYVHDLTGNGLNMGAIPWAAGDPIFWLHHCNIDRLWASWNAGGRQNLSTPTFLSKKFIFADALGHRVEATVKDFLDIAPLKYSYDHLEPVPKCPPPKAGVEAAPAERAALKAPVSLGTAPVRVELEPKVGTEAAIGAPGKRVFLVVKGLQANVAPGVLYHVYLELPAGTSSVKREDLHVGILSFFNAVQHDHDGTGGPGLEKVASYDVTDLITKLRSKKQLSGKPSLTIVPVGQPAAEAKPVVGSISLVEVDQ